MHSQFFRTLSTTIAYRLSRVSAHSSKNILRLHSNPARVLAWFLTATLFFLMWDRPHPEALVPALAFVSWNRFFQDLPGLQDHSWMKCAYTYSPCHRPAQTHKGCKSSCACGYTTPGAHPAQVLPEGRLVPSPLHRNFGGGLLAWLYSFLLY